MQQTIHTNKRVNTKVIPIKRKKRYRLRESAKRKYIFIAEFIGFMSMMGAMYIAYCILWSLM